MKTRAGIAGTGTCSGSRRLPLTFAVLCYSLIGIALFALQLPSAAADEPTRINKLREQWLDARERAKVPVDLEYLDELEMLQDLYAKAGRLSEALAVKYEIERLGNPKALNSSTEAPPKRLTQTRERWLTVRNRKLGPVDSTYEKELKKLLTEFTKQGRLEDAIAVREEVKTFRSTVNVHNTGPSDADQVIKQLVASGVKKSHIFTREKSVYALMKFPSETATWKFSADHARRQGGRLFIAESRAEMDYAFKQFTPLIKAMGDEGLFQWACIGMKQTATGSYEWIDGSKLDPKALGLSRVGSSKSKIGKEGRMTAYGIIETFAPSDSQPAAYILEIPVK